jgi:O-antigen ligase
MLVLVPLILVTGSRAGLALGILALISCFWVYRKPAISVPRKRQSKMANWQIPVLLIGLIVLGATTFLFSRAQALERLGQANESEDNRELLVQPLLEMTSSYFPWGTGMGAFPETYAISEAFELLDQTYLNHAHNDWLELAITGGLPALILAVIMLIALVRGGFNAMKTQNKKDGAMLFARLGFVILVILGLASVVDYPARTPTISCLAVLAAVWLYGNPIKQSDGNSKKDGTVPLPSLANALT